MDKLKYIIGIPVIICFLLFGCVKNTDNQNMTSVSSCASVSASTKAVKSKSGKQNNKTDMYDKRLESAISKEIPENNGIWSVYYKDLKSHEFCILNNQKMVAASLIKLYIMAAVYDQINHSLLQDTQTIENLIKQMITVSDNESSNELVKFLANGNHEAGMKIVNEYAKIQFFLETQQQRALRDWSPKPSLKQNYTSVENCGRLLEMIYRGKCVSKEYSAKMLEYLKRQERTWKIPAGLPEGVQCANKTGELPDTENDVAIVFTEKTDYVLCVMSNNVKSVSDAQETIRKISATVYEYTTQQ